MIDAQAHARALDDEPAHAQLGRDAFGARWQGSRSDWSSLDEIVRWEADAPDLKADWDHRAALARLDHPEACRTPLKEATAQLKAAVGRLQEIVKLLTLDPKEAFGAGSAHAVPIRDLLDRLGLWQQHPESLSRWTGYQVRRRRAEAAGLGALVDGLHDGRIAPEDSASLLQVAYDQALIRKAFRDHPDLAEFDGPAHERWVEEFRALDRARIELARSEVAAAHFDAIPRNAAGGELAVVRREFEKKRRHKPLRQLIREAGTAILGIKPVFLMSPISVAQYLEPGSTTFDLLLIDEASQISPVDALGAMARARQVVVVGDDKQLPPTRFFSKLPDEAPSPADPDDGLDAGDLESILGLCLAQGMAQRMLRWHYRSRHHSLIAVSNREFYDDRLLVVPSPGAVTPEHGLHFRPVPGGVFDRGNTATNRVEARAIAAAVIDHARATPNQSLGVGAFSVAQRDAIRDELEALQREHADLADFFSPSRPEPFFVKNLENIQGDERDVIFISVGYARDPSGALALNFGPLSAQGGERRLNVLISRARERCEVFSSITADDIDLQRARSRGAAAFKAFLRYASTGLLDGPAHPPAAPDSDFEGQVARALESHGWEVHRRAGTAGFLIDLAVVDPSRPGRYLLGVECDGSTYAAARSARDRDRLRDAVLRDRGWRLHRVWITDWFHRPGEQLQRLLSALDHAVQAADSPDEAPPTPSPAPPPPRTSTAPSPPKTWTSTPTPTGSPPTPRPPSPPRPRPRSPRPAPTSSPTSPPRSSPSRARSTAKNSPVASSPSGARPAPVPASPTHSPAPSTPPSAPASSPPTATSSPPPINPSSPSATARPSPPPTSRSPS